MSQDFLDEDWDQLAAWANEKIIVYVGRVKNKNDFSDRTESGISTTISYKLPLKYDSKDWTDVRIISYVIAENKAKTNVWGRPVGGRCLDEMLFKEFCKEHTPFELPKAHSEVVEKIRAYNLDLIKKGAYSTKIPEILVNSSENQTDDIPF